MAEIEPDFNRPAYACPAFGEDVPCAQLLNKGDALVDGNGVTNAEKVAICCATLVIASDVELPPQACGYQKFTNAAPDVQVRIRRIITAT